MIQYSIAVSWSLALAVTADHHYPCSPLLDLVSVRAIDD
jgi:hypothetical protein